MLRVRRWSNCEENVTRENAFPILHMHIATGLAYSHDVSEDFVELHGVEVTVFVIECKEQIDTGDVAHVDVPIDPARKILSV